MSKHQTNLTKGTVLPSTWVNALMEFVSTSAPNFKVVKASATTLQVVAGAGNDQVGIGIQGKWRYNVATVTATHPGGVAGTFDVYVTAADNDFSAADPLDNTNYSFGLAILATTVVPVTTLYRKVGTVTWDGAAITAVSVESVRAIGTAPNNVAAGDAHAFSGVVGIGGGATFGSAGDANLYRSGANTLKTDGRLDAVGLLTSNSALYGQLGTSGQVIVGQSSTTASLFFGSAADTNLHRAAAGTLKTDGVFNAGGVIYGQAAVVANNGTANVIQLASDGRLYFGATADTNLYRAGAAWLATDSRFTAGTGNSAVTHGLHMAKNVVTVQIGSQESTELYAATDYSGAIRFNGAGVAWGDFAYYPMAGDGHFKLWRSPALVGTTFADLKVNKLFTNAGIDVSGDNVHLKGAYGSGHLYFGPDAQARLYSPAAGQLRTSGSFTVDSTLFMGAVQDTSLYRTAAGALKTDGVFNAGGALYANQGGVFAIAIGAGGYIYFGSANDTNLYRSGAAYLRTDSSFMVDQEFRHLGATAGFYGVAAVAKPNVTGARSETIEDFGGVQQSVGNDLTLGNLLTALASLGLITNSTTP